MTLINNDNSKYAYLAGFIDADGSIYAQIKKNDSFKYKHQIQVTVQVTQATKRRWFLDRLKDEIGSGNVRDRGSKSGVADTENTEGVSDYILTEQSKVLELLKNLQPYLRLKKKQANYVIRIIEQLPSTKDSQEKFLEVCTFVDLVADANDSKTRTNTAKTVRDLLEGLSQDK
jgi:hypothetical protein